MAAASPVLRDTVPGAGTPGPGSPLRPARRRVLSLRWIVSAATALLTSAAVLSIGVVSEYSAREALSREMQGRVLLLARNLALSSSGALLGDYPELTLQPLVRSMLARQRELDFAVVLDHRGRVAGHPDPHLLGQAYASPRGLADERGDAPLGHGEWLRSNAKLLVAQAPVLGPDGQAIGAAQVGLKLDYVQHALARARRQQLLIMLLFVGLGMVSALVLTAQVLRPIQGLSEGLERIGRGDLDTQIDDTDRTELGLLAGTVNHMAGALKLARVEAIERERLSHEVELARQIQQSLLPSGARRVHDCVIEGFQNAANEVGGDYFDFLPLSDGRVAVSIADVAGKGLGGCLVTSMLSALLRALREDQVAPAGMLTVLDERLSESLKPGVFVTMFYGILDAATGHFVFANAGHNPLLVYRAGTRKVEVRRSRGIPLAAVRGGAIRRTLAEDVVVLGPGDLALQYTDGCTEAFRIGTDEEFGLERLIAVVEQKAMLGPRGVIEAILAEVQAWSGDGPAADDLTLLVVSRDAVASGVPGCDTAPMPDDATAAERLLASAERHGHGLQLPASLEALEGIRPWIVHTPGLAELRDEEREWIVSALYELCANIAEHGVRFDASQNIQLWWLPCCEPDSLPPGPAAERAGRFARRGVFVLCDHGAEFDPASRGSSDFADPEVRRRGRGIGLDIVNRVMRRVGYFPRTAQGNLTFLAYGPDVPPTPRGDQP